jgi:CheY-like chemotaxis protein
MTNNTLDTSPEFVEQVQDCLSHLYDYAFLQDHPVVALLTPDSAASQRVQVFRQTVIDAIEHFSPGSKIDFHSRQARTYNVLVLRYIEGHDPQDVLEQLAFSERQYYREHRRAIDALSRALWERIQNDAQADGNAAPLQNISVQSEIQRVLSHPDTAVGNLKSFLDGVSAAVSSLARAHDIKVEAYADSPSLIGLDLATLRQAVILITASLLPYTSSGSTLIVEGSTSDDETLITLLLTLKNSEDAALIPDLLAQQESLQYLLQALEVHIDAAPEDDGTFQVALSLPRRKHTILVVDDNPDVVDLFKRYLVGQHYQILSAFQAEHAITLARDEQPELIVLDIMLPGTDGWEMLQNFKNHPATKHIPVLICSVLEVPEVARSLGGDDYLRKPPGRSDFLTALGHWVK